jgi:hypothetical protein
MMRHRASVFHPQFCFTAREFGLRVDEDVDQGQVTLQWFRLATTTVCARLLLHGGSFLGASPQVVPPAV